MSKKPHTFTAMGKGTCCWIRSDSSKLCVGSIVMAVHRSWSFRCLTITRYERERPRVRAEMFQLLTKDCSWFRCSGCRPTIVPSDGGYAPQMKLRENKRMISDFKRFLISNPSSCDIHPCPSQRCTTMKRFESGTLPYLWEICPTHYVVTSAWKERELLMTCDIALPWADLLARPSISIGQIILEHLWSWRTKEKTVEMLHEITFYKNFFIELFSWISSGFCSGRFEKLSRFVSGNACYCL